MVTFKKLFEIQYIFVHVFLYLHEVTLANIPHNIEKINPHNQMHFYSTEVFILLE